MMVIRFDINPIDLIIAQLILKKNANRLTEDMIWFKSIPINFGTIGSS